MTDPLSLSMIQLRRIAQQAGLNASEEASAARIRPAGLLLVEMREPVHAAPAAAKAKKTVKPTGAAGRRLGATRKKTVGRRARA